MKYYCIKQHDITDCGAACLATICKQNGYKIGITRVIVDGQLLHYVVVHKITGNLPNINGAEF
jgi:hypothetical protein